MKGVSILVFILLVTFSYSKSQVNTDPFPYRWIPAFDVAALGVGFGMAGTGVILRIKASPMSASELALLNPLQVNAFDRFATRHYSRVARRISDIPFLAQFPIGLTTGLLITIKRPQAFRKFVLLSTMYLEGLSLTLGSTHLVKTSVLRPRPFLYNSGLSLAYRADAGVDGLFSFFSGHTSSVFYTATFLSIIYQDLYPDRWTRYLVWGGAMGLATTTGLMRILGGKHFPSDVLVGAGIGSLFGWFIPFMHKLPKRNRQAMRFYPIPGGIGINYQF